MIVHYIKVALRNFWKYKIQSGISVISLALGVVCFTLSLSWIRSEWSYDNFQSKSDRIYQVHNELFLDHSIETKNPYLLAQRMKEIYPEIEESCACTIDEIPFRLKGDDKKMRVLGIDSSFAKVFDLPGDFQYLYNPFNEKKVALTKKNAMLFFGSEDVTGRQLKTINNDVYTIEGVTDGWSENTNLAFDMIAPLKIDSTQYFHYCYTYIVLKPGTDIRLFEAKIKLFDFSNLYIVPLTKLRYSSPDITPDIKYNHLRIFVLASLLVILCSLSNYLTLFISRIRMRGREFALRKVQGSSDIGIVALLGIEFFLNLLFALIISTLFVIYIFPAFRDFSKVAFSGIHFLKEILMYIGILMVCAVLFGLFPIYRAHKKTLRETIAGYSDKSGNHIFRKISFGIQLATSFGFIFCVCVFFKQIHFLNEVDLGLNRHNIVQIRPKWDNYENIASLADKVSQIPTVTEVLKTNERVLPRGMKTSCSISRSKDFDDSDRLIVNIFFCPPNVIHFFEMDIIKGRDFLPEYPGHTEVIVNEQLVKEMKWANPIGQKIDLLTIQKEGMHTIGGISTVVGVVRDFVAESPISPIKPYVLLPSEDYSWFLYKLREGTRQETENAIKQMMKKDFPDNNYIFSYIDDTYEDMNRSENLLMKVLGVLSLACIITSVFGIYSITSLSCLQRRKEIAIRKINGASVLDILNIFFKEYLLLLVISSILAFSIGYRIMKPWMEQYIKQTSIDWWIYGLIFCFVSLLIITIIILQVWKTANENPAEVVKSE